MLSGFNITQLNGQLGLQEALDTGTSGMVLFDGGTVAELANPVKLLSYEDAKTKMPGIETPQTSIYFAIRESIRRYFAYTSSPLWVIGHNGTMAAALDTTTGAAATLLQAAEGDIRQLAVIGNHDYTTADHTTAMGTEMFTDVEDAINAAKALKVWTNERKRPIDIWIAGQGFTGAAAGAVDLRSSGAGAFNADHVSVSVMQDKTAIDLLEGAMDNDVLAWADIGTPLGMESRSGISIKYGRISDDDLTIASEGYYTTPMIAETSIEDYDDPVLTELDSKGYIFARRYIDTPGAYIEDLPCATPVTSDYNIRPYGRVWNEASRRLYRGMLPLVKRKVPLQDGLMVQDIADSWEQKGIRSLLPLSEADEIPGGPIVTIERQGEYVDGKWEFTVKFSVPVTAYGDIINGQIGLTLNS